MSPTEEYRPCCGGSTLVCMTRKRVEAVTLSRQRGFLVISIDVLSVLTLPFTKAVAGGFLEGAPIFAVEVRSMDDYGPNRGADGTETRRYFAAGTFVVWELMSARKSVRVYRRVNPANLKIYAAGTW